MGAATEENLKKSVRSLYINYTTENYRLDSKKYGWLDIPGTIYGDNASTDDNSVSDAPDITTPNILPKEQTAILPDDAMFSIMTMVETNLFRSSQYQKHPKKVLIKMEEQEEQLTTSAGPKSVPKKSSARKHTIAIKTELTE